MEGIQFVLDYPVLSVCRKTLKSCLRTALKTRPWHTESQLCFPKTDGSHSVMKQHTKPPTHVSEVHMQHVSGCVCQVYFKKLIMHYEVISMCVWETTACLQILPLPLLPVSSEQICSASLCLSLYSCNTGTIVTTPCHGGDSNDFTHISS